LLAIVEQPESRLNDGCRVAALKEDLLHYGGRIQAKFPGKVASEAPLL
jgi:hypothetical protein